MYLDEMPTHSAATQIAASHGYLAQAPAGGARPNTAAPWAVLILLGVTGQSEAATEVVAAVISLFRPPHLNRPSTRRPVTFGASVDADEGILEGGHDADHALPGAPLRLLTSTTNEVVLGATGDACSGHLSKSLVLAAAPGLSC